MIATMPNRCKELLYYIKQLTAFSFFQCRIEWWPTMIHKKLKVLLNMLLTLANNRNNVKLTCFLNGIRRNTLRDRHHGTFVGGYLWRRPNVARAGTTGRNHTFKVDIFTVTEMTFMHFTASRRHRQPRKSVCNMSEVQGCAAALPPLPFVKVDFRGCKHRVLFWPPTPTTYVNIHMKNVNITVYFRDRSHSPSPEPPRCLFLLFFG